MVEELFLSFGVSGYFEDAHALVDAVLGDEGLSESLLTTIEKWLAAHFIAVTKSRQPQYKKIGDGAESYPKLGLKLDASTYGKLLLHLIHPVDLLIWV